MKVLEHCRADRAISEIGIAVYTVEGAAALSKRREEKEGDCDDNGLPTLIVRFRLTEQRCYRCRSEMGPPASARAMLKLFAT